MSLLVAHRMTRRGDGGRVLLDGIDFELEAADRVALGGPSGSGKTQLLRALALLDPLESGEIRWHGSPVSEEGVPSYRSRVIYHQQRPALFEGSVEENLRRPFELGVHQERSFDRARAAGLFERLGLAELFEEATSADLSGGERQIVGLVRLLLLDPEVALLDEPSASLDAATEERVVALMDEWIGAGGGARAYVWVTHDRGLAEQVGRRSVEVASGRLVVGGVDG